MYVWLPQFNERSDWLGKAAPLVHPCHLLPHADDLSSFLAQHTVTQSSLDRKDF